MSCVTDIILIVSVSDVQESPQDGSDICLQVDMLNNWMEHNYQTGACLKYIDCTGGNKVFQANLYASSFNHFPLEEFIDFFKLIKWIAPKRVQLLFQDENDENGFTATNAAVINETTFDFYRGA